MTMGVDHTLCRSRGYVCQKIMAETPPRKTPHRLCSGIDPQQTLDSQLEQLRASGCSGRNIYREKVTGTRADRRELLRMLKRLAPATW
jgi:hypothetical protein